MWHTVNFTTPHLSYTSKKHNNNFFLVVRSPETKSSRYGFWELISNDLFPGKQISENTSLGDIFYDSFNNCLSMNSLEGNLSMSDKLQTKYIFQVTVGEGVLWAPSPLTRTCFGSSRYRLPPGTKKIKKRASATREVTLLLYSIYTKHECYVLHSHGPNSPRGSEIMSRLQEFYLFISFW